MTGDYFIKLKIFTISDYILNINNLVYEHKIWLL